MAFIAYSSTQFILREYGPTLFADSVDNVVTQAFEMNGGGGGGALVTILTFSLHYGKKNTVPTRK